MTDSNPKNATDLLLEMSDKLDKALALLNNHDLLLKTLNNKLNSKSSEAPLIPSVVSNAPVQVPTMQKPMMPGLKPGVTLQQSVNGPVLTSSTIEAKKESTPQKKAKDAPVKKIGIQQRIVYKEDNKSVIMATVRVFQKTRGPDNTPFSALVEEKKTNTTGKWISALDPGEYEIKISKQGSSDRANIDASYTITVPNSDEPVQLDLKAV